MALWSSSLPASADGCSHAYMGWIENLPVNILKRKLLTTSIHLSRCGGVGVYVCVEEGHTEESFCFEELMSSKENPK